MKSDHVSTSINASSSDWSLLFGTFEDNVHRSAPLGDTEETEFSTLKPLPQKKNSTNPTRG